MLKEYLKNINLSIYKLSEISNVPYTTINELVNGKKSIDDCKIKTIESIAKSLNLSIESLMKLIKNDNTNLSTSWIDNKDKKFYFPILIENCNYECNRIHPLKQRVINEIYNELKLSNIVDKAIIFGSSINIRCTNKSDIDIAILLKSKDFTQDNQNILSEKIQEITGYNADIVWLNTLNNESRLYQNIYMKGVTVYE